MLVAEVRRRDQPDLSSLREIAYGTAPITPSSLTAAVAAFGCRFRQIYGNTESQSMISLLAPEDHQPGHPRLASAGRVSFGWEVRIVDRGWPRPARRDRRRAADPRRVPVRRVLA